MPSDDEIDAAAHALCFYQTRPCPGRACGACRQKAVAALSAAATVRRAQQSGRPLANPTRHASLKE